MFYGCYALIVAATVRGRLSLGDMTLYLVAFRQGQQSFQSVLSALGGMYEDTLYMSNLFDYFAIPTDDAHASGPVAGSARRGGHALRGRRLQVPGGGEGRERGSGRCAASTCSSPRARAWRWSAKTARARRRSSSCWPGLYDPTEGRVLLDGRDLRTWDERELRARIGVIFQDFNEYQLALRENVGVRQRRPPGRRAARRARGRSGRREGAGRRRWRPGWTRSSGAGSRTASSCRAGSGRRWRSRARSCARRPTS